MNYYILNRRSNRYYTFIGFLGIGSLLWELLLFDKSIVDPLVVVAIMVVAALLASPVEFRTYGRTYSFGKKAYLFFFLFLTCLISWGLIVGSLFVITNYYFCDKANPTTAVFKIIDVGTRNAGIRRFSGSRKQPMFRVNYNGKVKRLAFSSDYLENREDYDSIRLTTAHGLFNYDVVLDQELIKRAAINTVEFQWLVRDTNTQSIVTNSRAIIRSFGLIDTVMHGWDSLSFQLDFDQELSVEFAAPGYESKTILINTYAPEDEREYGFLIAGMIIELIPNSSYNSSDTVGFCSYNHAVQIFDCESLRK